MERAYGNGVLKVLTCPSPAKRHRNDVDAIGNRIVKCRKDVREAAEPLPPADLVDCDPRVGNSSPHGAVGQAKVARRGHFPPRGRRGRVAPVPEGVSWRFEVRWLIVSVRVVVSGANNFAVVLV